jgi:hypothetical protein
MNKLKLFAGILIFGSLWGFSEVFVGSGLTETGLPSGAIMTGVFAMMFLVMSRMLYRQPGMQLGMGLVAGGLKLFNPFITCNICSALAIMAEGAIFELIWYKLLFDSIELRRTMQVSMGVITGYCVFIGGYVVTQILTPIVAGPGFYLENLIILMPNILADGLLAALVAGIVLPAILLTKKVDIKMKDRLYYPTTLGVSAICWFIVIGSWILFAA